MQFKFNLIEFGSVLQHFDDACNSNNNNKSINNVRNATVVYINHQLHAILLYKLVYLSVSIIFSIAVAVVAIMLLLENYE